MNKNEKILPMKYPFITSYPNRANLLSVLLNHRETIPWMLSQYIQLELPKAYYFPRLDFYTPDSLKTCPWIYYQRISRCLINLKWGSFTEFLIDCITQEFYVYVFLSLEYFGYTSNHDRFIYGYDKEEQMFYVADFYIHKAAAYAFEKIPFSDIEKAYQSTHDDKDWLCGVELISYRKIKRNFFRKSEVEFKFDINSIKMLLQEYLYGINSSKTRRNSNEQYKRDFAFGLDVYKQLEKYMNEAHKNLDMDTRPFHVLYDHKRYMLFLVDYLRHNYDIYNSKIIYNSYYNMTQKVFKLRLLVLRYNVKATDALIKIMYDLLSSLYSEEKETITTLIEAIEKINDSNGSNNLSKSKFNNKKGDFSFSDINIYDKRLHYSDGWYANFEILGRIISSTNSSNEFLIVDFLGTEISYFAPKNNKSGYVDIYIDGIKRASIDLYSLEPKETELIYHEENLSPGHHMFKIECTGIKNGNAQDCEISFEKLKIHKHKNKIITENVAVFMEEDTETKGSWKSVYGSEGYDILGKKKLLPFYANYIFENANNYVWDTNTTDIRALQIPDSSEGRIAFFKNNEDSFTIDLIITGDKLKNVTFYICDYGNFGRKLQVIMIDYDTQCVLCTHDVDNYNEGIYLKYNMKGRVLVTFKAKWGNALLSGIFFD